MYRVPSRRKQRHEVKKPNLIPILDAVFIFIFFLLMSANFLKVYEIGSDVPIVSDSPPPKSKKKELALTLRVSSRKLTVSTGIPSRVRKSFSRNGEGEYDLEGLHKYLIGLKEKHTTEKTIILEPVVDLKYEEIVKIMDAVRSLKNTDPAIYGKDKDGIDVKINELFSNIVFGNIQS